MSNQIFIIYFMIFEKLYSDLNCFSTEHFMNTLVHIRNPLSNIQPDL